MKASASESAAPHPWAHEIAAAAQWWGQQAEECYPPAGAGRGQAFAAALERQLRKLPAVHPLVLHVTPEEVSPAIRAAISSLHWAPRRRTLFKPYTLTRIKEGEALVSLGHGGAIRNLIT